MQRASASNTVIAVVVGLLAVLVVFVWIPADTATGIVEKVRGRTAIGDALAPTVAGAFLLLGSVLILIFERRAPDQPVLSLAQMGFLLRCVGVIVAGVLVMRWTGPLLAELFNLFRAEPISYRLLRASPGWQQVGFATGGVVMVSGLIAIVEHGFSRRGLLTALGAVALLIAVFDLPFQDLLLPPNGDV